MKSIFHACRKRISYDGVPSCLSPPNYLGIHLGSEGGIRLQEQLHPGLPRRQKKNSSRRYDSTETPQKPRQITSEILQTDMVTDMKITIPGKCLLWGCDEWKQKNVPDFVLKVESLRVIFRKIIVVWPAQHRFMYQVWRESAPLSL